MVIDLLEKLCGETRLASNQLRFRRGLESAAQSNRPNAGAANLNQPSALNVILVQTSAMGKMTCVCASTPKRLKKKLLSANG